MFSPIQIGPMTVKNRFVVPPMGNNFANSDGTWSDESVAYYGERAKGQFGLITIEATVVHKGAKGGPKKPCLYDDNSIESLKKITDACHEEGAKVSIQLQNAGPEGNAKNAGAPIQAATAIASADGRDIPEEVSTEKVYELVKGYGEAAERAMKGGSDAVEIHMAHGYLVNSFMSPRTNKRVDEFGGSFENRSRLMLDITKLIAENTDKSVILASRLGICDMIAKPYGFGMADDGQTPDFTEANELIGKLSALGVSLIDMTMGSPYFNPYINRPQNKGERIPPEHPLVGVDRLIHGAEAIQKANPSVAVVGTGYSYLREFAPYAAAGALERGYSTLVGFGRMAFAYDRFADDFISGNTDKSKVCLACSKCTEIMRAGGTTGCPLRDQEIYLPIYRRLCMKK